MAFIFDKIGLPTLPSNGIPFPNPGRIGATLINLFTPEREEIWGIFDETGTTLIIAADTVEEIGVNTSATVAKFPVVDGGFANYNKVQNPDEISLIVSKGGLDATGRESFIRSLNDLKKSLRLVTVFANDVSYKNLNLHDFSYRATLQSGSHIVIANLKLSEIRQVKAQYKKAKQATKDAKKPEAKPAKDKGSVQPKTSLLSDAVGGIGKIKDMIGSQVDTLKKEFSSWLSKGK